jgi:hypothetical protein
MFMVLILAVATRFYTSELSLTSPHVKSHKPVTLGKGRREAETKEVEMRLKSPNV